MFLMYIDFKFAKLLVYDFLTLQLRECGVVKGRLLEIWQPQQEVGQFNTKNIGKGKVCNFFEIDAFEDDRWYLKAREG